MGCSTEEVERLIVKGDIKRTRDSHGTPLVFTPLPRYRPAREGSVSNPQLRSFWRSPAGVTIRVTVLVLAIPLALRTGVDYLITYTVLVLLMGFVAFMVGRRPSDGR